ncbi:MAG: SDR family NAD(P)-dependent oxidoreductase [Chitinophagaceae bacterium]
MKNKLRFYNKHVLVTGGARGIGLEIARQFAAQGAVVSLLDVHKENLKKAAAQISKKENTIYAYNVDVSNQKKVNSVIAKADAIKPIDILINNAGIAFETPFLNIEAAEWSRIININLTGMFFVAQSVCRLMANRGKGTVVNMASKNGLDGEFGYAHYNASKGGVIMLTKTMALELAHYGIRVNAVCPGYIQTPMSMEIDPPEFTKNFVKQFIPLNRPGRVEEIAPLFLFLAGDESSFMTGQIMVADGGQLAGQNPSPELLSKIRFKKK